MSTEVISKYSVAYAVKQEWLPAVPPPSHAEILAVLAPIADKWLSPDDYGYPEEIEPGDIDDSQMEEVFISRATIRAARELIVRLTPRTTKSRSTPHVLASNSDR